MNINFLAHWICWTLGNIGLAIFGAIPPNVAASNIFLLGMYSASLRYFPIPKQ